MYHLKCDNNRTFRKTIFCKTHPVKLQKKREATYAKWRSHNNKVYKSQKGFIKSFGMTKLIRYAKMQEKLNWVYPKENSDVQ